MGTSHHSFWVLSTGFKIEEKPTVPLLTFLLLNSICRTARPGTEANWHGTTRAQPPPLPAAQRPLGTGPWGAAAPELCPGISGRARGGPGQERVPETGRQCSPSAQDCCWAQLNLLVYCLLV